MILSFIDKNGNQLDDLDVFFEYNNISEIKITNTDGIIELSGIEEGSGVSCYVSKKKKKTFEFNEEGELSITFERPTVNMRFVVAKQNGEAATDLNIHFEYNGKVIEEQTDSTGQIILKKIPLKTQIKAFQLFKGKEENLEHFQCERDKAQYFYVAEKLFEKATMKFKLVDKNGQPIKNSDLRFKYEEKEFEAVTDNEGRISIKEIKVGSSVECKQLMFGKLLPWHKFNLDKEIDEYIIHGEKQTPFGQENENYDSQVRMKIKLVNSKSEPIANAIIKLDYDGKERRKYTNLNGEIQIDDILIGSKIKVFVDVRGDKAEAEFFCNTDNETQQITLKTGNSKLIFWLISLVIIIGMAILYSKVDLSSFKKTEKEAEPEKIIKDTVIIRNYKITVKDKSQNKTLKNAKIELVYKNSIHTKFSDNLGQVNFKAIAGKIPAEIKISLLGYNTSIMKFVPDSSNTVYITKNDSLDIGEEYLECGSFTQSAGFGTTFRTFHMKMDKGRFNLFYNMFDLPDQIDIYNGPAHTISEKKLIYSSKKMVIGLKNLNVTFNSADSLITVKVKGNDNATNWLYKVFCPKKILIQN